MADIIFAQSRFGLGPRSDEPLEAHPRAWAADQISRYHHERPADLPTRGEVAGSIRDFFTSRRAQQQLQEAVEAGQAGDDPQAMRRMLRQPIIRQGMDFTGSRLNRALVTGAPFAERLVHFWSNHFAVSSRKPGVFGFAGLMEEEAIRPHVTGRFEDMLLAAVRHPAMLLYLDQAQSFGPESQIARIAARRGRKLGLNENLAREILELHTLGVRSGYGQEDVSELARALTGWTVAGLGRGPLQRFARGKPGDFAFVAQMHQPGGRRLLGQRFAEGGAEQAEEMLKMLARRPETARHVATKLARHFGADEPPPAMVARLEAAYLDSGGDLGVVSRAIVESPEAWREEPAKFRAPWDWLVASLRAVGARDLDARMATGILNELGQPTYQPPSPAGWDDIAASWAGPDALMRRVEVAQRIADRAGRALDARELAPKLLGSRLAPATATAIRRAESPVTGLALLIASPEMLRR